MIATFNDILCAGTLFRSSMLMYNLLYCAFKNSMHQTDLLDSLITCSMAGHDVEAVVFGLQPFDYHTMQVGLTPDAEKLLPTIADQRFVMLCPRRDQ